MTPISVLDVVNTGLGAIVLVLLLALVVRLHATVTLRDDILNLHSELDAIKLWMKVHEQTSPCAHCRAHHCDDDCNHGRP